MANKHKSHQHIWFVECEQKPNEITDFINQKDSQTRAIPDLDEVYGTYYWLWTDNSEKCFLHIQ